MRKSIVALAVAAALMCASANQSNAAVPPPAPAVATGTAVGVGVWAAGGVIAVAAALCIYDVWLKINGIKNWDGSPKVVRVVHHQHH
jgi:hypothetical protein